MKKIVALPALALVFGLAACATTTKEAAPAPTATSPAPYSGQSSPGEPELLGAPKKEQGS